VKIDMARMTHGEDVAKRLRKGRGGGIPWMVILDADGKELITSLGPKGNCGCPVLPHERDHFMNMVRQAAQTMTANDIDAVEKLLSEFAKPFEERLRTR